ncbi:hypothetical protein CGLO_12837 [Colletotrichum gloeosporioides Cg-14]|uniref:Uncharacterized protein n=1 Tax=Colletotrichum gloeosporioides (strain Cg-14) TaxID=1237896 RepID=T0JXS2_COLGC|nr:hypothetical protein CGLO_12837 [Colletotrichum gloeosporioides Cg-14]
MKQVTTITSDIKGNNLSSQIMKSDPACLFMSLPAFYLTLM